MKNLRIGLGVVVIAVLAMADRASANPPESRHFVSPLSGDEEVPPRDTGARGIAVYQLSRDESELEFTLIVANIENVFAAHIHCGPPGVNGPVGITLFGPVAPGGGRVNGVIARGTNTAPDSGNACGWATLADAVAAMRSGDAYTNVHTNDGVEPPNTGPGDFPGGEIRGQIQETGATR